MAYKAKVVRSVEEMYKAWGLQDKHQRIRVYTDGVPILYCTRAVAKSHGTKGDCPVQATVILRY